MLPLTMLTTNKLLQLLTTSNALSLAIRSAAALAGIDVPVLPTSLVIGSYAGPELGDLDLQLIYPRVCVFSSNVANTRREKFRSFSGSVLVVADVWSSASLEQNTETALHFYLDGIATLLRANVGDWGDGVRYAGGYETHMLPPKAGGAGFIQSARLTCSLEVSLN